MKLHLGDLGLDFKFSGFYVGICIELKSSDDLLIWTIKAIFLVWRICLKFDTFQCFLSWSCDHSNEKIS